MSLFCKKFSWLTLLLSILSTSAQAITLNGIYFGTCQREIGVILNVDENQIQLLNLDGEIKDISRFDIIYLVDYPVGNIPIQKVINTNKKQAIVVDTLNKNKPEELVRGWPLDFSDQSILFLTTKGDEVVISRRHIFKIRQMKNREVVRLKNAASSLFYYQYPALFNHCELDKSVVKSRYQNYISPQQVIGNALLIKSNLDRLMNGYKKVNSYLKNQQFYAIPNIYNNSTKIGLWYNYNSRHGTSSGRNNNIIPFIVSDYSDGPFGFQRQIITGVYTMPYSAHEEPQTLFSYSLKADYFHFSGMFDPSLIMTGPNYSWKENDLDNHDDRIFEMFHLSAGLDWGPLAMEVGIPVYNIGIRTGEYFANYGVSMYRNRILFQNQFIKTELYFGRNTNSEERDNGIDDRDYEEGLGAGFKLYLMVIRFNFALICFDKFEPQYSLIYRKLDFERSKDIKDMGQFEYESLSITNYLAIDYYWINDITLTGYASLEVNNINFDSQKHGPGNEKDVYFKCGTRVMLEF